MDSEIPAAMSEYVQADEEAHRRRYPGAFSSEEPSPYEKSGMAESGSIIELNEELGSQRLFNQREPFYPIQHERPEHRIVLFLKAEGHSNLEIARLTGRSAVSVSNICRQPWAVKRITDIIHESGGNAVNQLLQGAAADAVNRLITEMDNDKARSSERITAADKILDRVYGKPNQPMTHMTVDPKELTDEELAKFIPTTTGTSSTGTNPPPPSEG